MDFYSPADGAKLVRAARNAIELYIGSREFRNEAVERTIPGFTQKHGVFVTLYHYPTMSLRGCIGFSEPIGELKGMLVEAAVAAAADDPRFVPVSHLELEHLLVEVSVLSAPERLKGSPEAIRKQVRIGRDGLIIEYGYNKGLLLPIVAVEERWSVPKFLGEVCIKAGLPEHAWRSSGAQLYRFSTQVFREREPRGRAEEVRLETP
jgi:uncharacterized protein (TIGR00296 family)